MSYILDSLKKLEQEKLAQTRQCDIKSALLRAEGSEKNVADLKKTVRNLMGIFGGLCVLALAVVFYERYPREVGSASSPEAKQGEKADGMSGKIPANPVQRREGPVVTDKKPHAGAEIREKRPQNKKVAAIKEIPPVLHQMKPVTRIKGMARFRPPRFTIKAVIFFGEENPGNYIILRDNRNERLRLKRGDRYMNMELAHIRAHKALFLENGRILEKGMGD